MLPFARVQGKTPEGPSLNRRERQQTWRAVSADTLRPQGVEIIAAVRRRFPDEIECTRAGLGGLQTAASYPSPVGGDSQVDHAQLSSYPRSKLLLIESQTDRKSP